MFDVMPISRKAAGIKAVERYHLQDDLAGYTVPPHSFRNDYKKAVRHTRRADKMAIRFLAR